MFQKEGLPVTIVRPGIVIGPFCKVFFPHLGYNFQEKVFIIIGKGDNILPLTFVENTVDAVYKAVASEKALGNAYNIVDDGGITVLDYIQRYAGFSSNPCKIIRVPYLVPFNATLAYEIAAGLGLIGKGKTSRSQLRWKQKKVFFSNQKAKDELAWRPQVPLEKALDRTFEWYGRLNAIN
jgi:nucleoside-diphosphate-sugar epimerase